MKFIEGEDIDFHYADSIDDINDIEDFPPKGGTQLDIAADTETFALSNKYGDKASALDPHTSQIRLLQLNKHHNKIPLIIDVQKIGIDNLLPFVTKLSTDYNKILHYAQFDLKQIRSTFGIWWERTFCTNVAMQTLGVSTGYKASRNRKHTLKALSRDLFDVHLNKLEATSDWSIKDLTASQLEYAALDVGAPKSRPDLYSIVLQAYDLLYDAICKPMPFGYDEQVAFTIDQNTMYVCSRMEYVGMPINLDLLNILSTQTCNLMESYRLSLCNSLNLSLLQEIIIDNETGLPRLVTIVPKETATLLNNNKKLVNNINDALNKTLGINLNSLQAAELKEILEEIEKKNVDDEETEATNDDLDDSNELLQLKVEQFYNSDIKLIKDLLSYKKYNKLLSELNKYKSVINIVTNRIHTSFGTIGAATSRMNSFGDFNLQQVSNESLLISLLDDIFNSLIGFI